MKILFQVSGKKKNGDCLDENLSQEAVFLATNPLTTDTLYKNLPCHVVSQYNVSEYSAA